MYRTGAIMNKRGHNEIRATPPGTASTLSFAAASSLWNATVDTKAAATIIAINNIIKDAIKLAPFLLSKNLLINNYLPFI